MSATAFAAVASFEEIVRCKNVLTVFNIKVHPFDQWSGLFIFIFIVQVA